MSSLVHHALLGTACIALFGAGLRLASRMTDDLFDRLASAFVLATAAAVIEALFLGLFKLGSNPLVLPAVAVATFACVRAARPGGRRTHELVVAAFRRLTRTELALAGALAAATALLIVWPLAYPILGFDGAVYHLPEIAGWVKSGQPGTIELVSYLQPFSNYPVTNEVALAWAAGISRSLVPILLWTQILYVVAAATGFRGLRALGVSAPVSAVAIAALMTTPICVQELGTPSTDIAGLCWLLCSASLAVRSAQQPGFIAPAIVAAGLAIGTKTTTAALAGIVLALLVWHHRRRLRAHLTPLLASSLAALAVSAPWYVRNLIDHGSPLWPFKALPGGDPVPHAWSLLDPSLLQRPLATIRGRTDLYLEALEGALLLMLVAPFAGLVTRRRVDIAASLAAALAVLLWAAAPSTGEPETPVFSSNVVGTTRYLLPALAAVTVAVALAASRRSRTRPVLLGILTIALGMNLVQDAQLEADHLPYGWLVVVVVAAGAVAALALARVPAHRPPLRWTARAGIALALLGVTAVLAAAASSLIRRHAQTAPVPGVALTRWIQAQPGFGSSQPIYFAGTVFGQLGGADLRHRLVLLSSGTSCATAGAIAARGLLVVAGDYARVGLRTPNRCSFDATPAYEGGDTRVYGHLAGGSGHLP